MPRRFQFSLRVLLVAVTLFSIGIAIIAYAESMAQRGNAIEFVLATLLGWSACGSSVGVVTGRDAACWASLGWAAAGVYCLVMAVVWLNEIMQFPGYAG